MREHILWTDEAHFPLNIRVNTENRRILLAENSQETVQERFYR